MKRNSLLPVHCAIRKYGAKAFTVRVLKVVGGTRADLMANEVKYIAKFHTRAPRGYNLTAGGDGVDFGIPAVKKRHRESVRKANAKTILEPAWKEAQLKGARKRSKTPKWKKAHALAMSKLYADPEFRQKHAKAVRASLDEDWHREQTVRLKKRNQDPEFQKRVMLAVQKRAANPVAYRKFIKALKAGAAKRVADPKWRRKSLKNLKKARAITAEKVLERDAKLTVEELARLQKQRAACRRSYAKAKKRKS